jgi:molybdate transport system ATP-binding protein
LKSPPELNRFILDAPPVSNSLITFDHADLSRPGGEPVFRDFSWMLRKGETWAVVGPVGSGKSSLAEALLGRLHLESGMATWPLLDRLRVEGRAVNWPSEVIFRVAFKEESRLFSYARHYYQQRFNFIEPNDDLTLIDFLCSGTAVSEEEVVAAARQLGVEAQLPLSFIKLSNGQARRARIAKALLSQPELLILDDPFMGLDAAGRDQVSELLGSLVKSGRRLLLICRSDAIPEWATHVLELKRMQVAFRDPRNTYVDVLRDARSSNTQYSVLSTQYSAPRAVAERETILDLRNVTVAYGERCILSDISWTVRAGERWAMLGPNGSGKTTLLSLLCGDHPQAYSNEVYLFGRRRGTGETIWDIKQRVGLVSPELHVYFSEPLSAARTAATGFFDVLTDRPTTAEQERTVAELFGEFGIAELADRPFAKLSTGEQRLILLIRALVKRPPLLILDEPFQGIDFNAMNRVRQWLDNYLRTDQTLIFVTHHSDEIPAAVDRLLRLDAGKRS